MIHLGEHEFPEKGVIHFLRQFTAPGPRPLFLHQNSPNPFTSSTTIRFALGTDERAVLSIYDSAGRLIRTLSCEGDEIVWDGTDGEGHRLPAGVYTYRIGDMARKMVLVK